MTRFAVLSPAKAGRPRDPQLEERVFRAALDLYGEAGWAGFNLTKIAAEAGVGKSSLYSRWSDRDELLHRAFAALVVCPGPRGDSPREILANEADFRLREYLGPNRSAVRRLFVEAGNAENPVIWQIYEDLFVTPLDAIEGSVLMRTFCLPDDVIGCFLEKVPDYVSDLVDDQLHHHEPSRQLED